ncbi:MAG TPA: alanine dehydrogenase [Candidatus Eisenbacteria bacterium]|nr:alanine dehydrogenase [Candidatus Eisenbacteria bacterium]
MDIGILKETYSGETRVALIPFAVGELVRQGNRVVIQSDAGAGSGFDDQAYRDAGATIVYSAEEVIGRSRVILKVIPPSLEECRRLEEGKILFSFLHLSSAPRSLVEHLVRRRVTAIGFEAIGDENGDRPVLTAMSEIAGKLAIPIAAQYLQTRQGGRGIMLDGIPGVPPGIVVILGAGVVGSTAAVRAAATGAQVIVLDRDVERLRRLHARVPAFVTTAVATPYNIERFVPIADALIGAVLIPMETTPHVLDERLVRSMRPRSVFLDVSIDQGGCSTTSRPTNILDPTYVREGVVHFCVPNIPALVPRTATAALSNIILPYLTEIARLGPDRVLHDDPVLARGVYTHDGYCLEPKIASVLDLPYRGAERERSYDVAR